MASRFATSLLIALLAGLVCVAAPSSASAEEEEDSYRPPTNQTTGFRIGFVVNNLTPVQEGATAFRYFDLGVRQKAGEYYFDLRAPVLFVVADALFTLLSMRFRENPELLFITMNDAGVPGHTELAHGRLGYRFRIVPPGDFEVWKNSLEAAVGAFASADLVTFDMREDVNAAETQNLGYNDPLVLGAGAFFAVGRTTEEYQFDIAVGGGMGIRGESNNAERSVYIAMIDADVQFELPFRGAFYIRPRLTTFITRLDPAINYALGMSMGFNLRF